VFWYDEATWVTARATYQPQLIAEFTLNHLTRNQLAMGLGISDTTASSPTTQWSPSRILWYAGGAWAFDGLSTAIDGTFCLDFTDLLPNPATAKRYYLRMTDSAAGNAATLKSFKLVDFAHSQEIRALPCRICRRLTGLYLHRLQLRRRSHGVLPQRYLSAATSPWTSSLTAPLHTIRTRLRMPGTSGTATRAPGHLPTPTTGPAPTAT
jgi:hypothetical protein